MNHLDTLDPQAPDIHLWMPPPLDRVTITRCPDCDTMGPVGACGSCCLCICKAVAA